MTTLDLIGAREAAKILGLTVGGVNLAVRDGRIIPAARVGARGVNVFDRAEIERLAEQEATA